VVLNKQMTSSCLCSYVQVAIGWSSEMKSGFLVSGVLFLSFTAFAQQAVTIPVTGATKPIQGDLYGGGTRGVILSHGGGRTKESWRKQAPALTDAGFVVLAIDFRGDTITDKGPSSLGSDEDNARGRVVA
jgi:hypothetical protein